MAFCRSAPMEPGLVSPTERAVSWSPLKAISVLCIVALKERTTSFCESKSTSKTLRSLNFGSELELVQDRFLRLACRAPGRSDLDEDRIAGFLGGGEGAGCIGHNFGRIRDKRQNCGGKRKCEGKQKAFHSEDLRIGHSGLGHRPMFATRFAGVTGFTPFLSFGQLSILAAGSLGPPHPNELQLSRSPLEAREILAD